MPNKYDTVSSQVRFSNKYWDYNLDIYKLPDGSEGEYHYVHSRGATFIIPKLDEDVFILTKQYRYLNKKYSIEFPGGGQVEGLSSQDNARKELLEETGYTAERIKLIGTFNPFNGVTDEICSIFLADGLTFYGMMPDITEEIEVIKLTKQEIINQIANGEIWDGISLAAFSIFYFGNY
jgi:ADP-ribose pyrophosphatase